MSLTTHLRDPGSPVRAYLDGILQGGDGTAEGPAPDITHALALSDLARSQTLVPPTLGVDVTRSGTAVDFRARIALGGFDPYDSAAALGVAELPFHVHGVDNGEHRARILAEAFDVATRILKSQANARELDRASLLLACCEQVHRGGAEVLQGSLGDALDGANDGLAFSEMLGEPSLVDLQTLMDINAMQLDEWRDRVTSGERFEPNPVFVGSALVGGADGDWLIGDALIESKSYAELTVPILRGFVRQLLGYVMLDLDDSLGIRNVGLWLPRQRVTKVWPLERLLGSNPEALLVTLRKGFATAANGKGVAARVPVTQRRMHQILAENKHTPRRMLVELAGSEDADIRMRVGRNAVTPEETVRKVARDRYAKVREGVASNENAPVDVLDSLSRDSSVVVQRAAAKNLRAPRTKKALSREQASTGHSDVARQANSVIAPNVRDDAGLSSHWFAEFFALTQGSGASLAKSRIPLPEASERWAWKAGRAPETPGWLTAGLPDEVKFDLFRDGRPAWLRRWIARGLPISDPDVRGRLLADSDPEIRWSTLRRTVDAPDDALSGLLGGLATDKNERARFRTGGDDRPKWPGDDGPGERDSVTLNLVASHPSTPRAALDSLFKSKSPNVLVSLMCNPALVDEDLNLLLPRLRTMRAHEPRERLATSGRIPAVAAGFLVADRDWRVRAALARNEAVPYELLSRLSEDPEPVVRLGVLANLHADAGLAASVAEALLASSTNEFLLEVVREIGRREDLNLSAELLETALDRLSKSRVREPDMRWVAARHRWTSPKTLNRLARSANEDVRRAVAGNPGALPETLAALALDHEASVRASVAGNAALDGDALAQLGRDEDPLVRASAASSPRLAPSLLGELVLDEARTVRSAAFFNPSLRPEDRARAEMERDRAWRESAPSRSTLEEMVASTRAEVRIRAAYDSRTPPDILRLLAGERRSAKVRRAAAAHPSTPADVLASLANDKDTEVRQSVAFNELFRPVHAA